MDDNTQRPMQQQDGGGQARQPGQQNQQADRQPRSGERIEGSGEDGLNSGLEGGVDTSSLEPGRTGDGGAER
jgi:hypothetical protein